MSIGDITGWNYVIQALNWIASFFNTTIYELFIGFGSWLVQELTIMSITGTIYALVFAWDIAQQILVDLQISALLNNAWAGLDSVTLDTLNFFGIPDVVNLILGSFVTKWVLRFIPGV